MDCREHEHKCNFWIYKFHIKGNFTFRRNAFNTVCATKSSIHSVCVFSGTRLLAVGLGLKDWTCSRVSNRCSMAFGSVLTELFLSRFYFTMEHIILPGAAVGECFLPWAYAYQSDFYMNAGTNCIHLFLKLSNVKVGKTVVFLCLWCIFIPVSDLLHEQ